MLKVPAPQKLWFSLFGDPTFPAYVQDDMEKTLLKKRRGKFSVTLQALPERSCSR